MLLWLPLPLACCICLSCISSPLAVSEFMIQGGDVTGTGKGNVSVWGTTFANEVNEAVRFSTRGLLAMANAYPKATPTGCHLLTLDSTPHLNGTATIFGKVIHGNDTLAAIEAVPVDADDRPLTPVTIDRVTIHANPLADRPSSAALLGQA
eukprot:TRINITY_DN898_c0_g2_i2.p3 TRINITY_DN898_c0_g2~~TRINITY_DN898_c0_g2_i2.p3  ORF type:complete len:151 (-),score=27.18 TRINITY_DN898_c0_g2_i2:178-630(-)